MSRGDFNGDTFADLAIGTPLKNSPSSVTDSGAVYVIYGSANGLVPAGQGPIPPIPFTQFWSQNTPGIPGTSAAGDQFGSALAAGEFNGDDFSDLAVGIPNDDIGDPNTGRVVVIYGSPRGLTATDSTVPAAQSFNLTNVLSDQHFFAEAELGSALSWGDFDGDQIGDLAMGAPEFQFAVTGAADPFISDGGAVWVVFGESGVGLGTAGQQFFTMDSPGIEGQPEDGDHFGEVLAAGDFNEDNRSDLAVGSPDKDAVTIIGGAGASELRERNAGFVHVIPGGQTGMSLAGSQLFGIADFDGVGFAGVAAAGDKFGGALAGGDFDGDGAVDLAIGAPGANRGSTTTAGIVFVIDSAGSSLGGRELFDQSSLFPGASENGDRFGHALAAGDFDDNGFADLAVGVPFEDVVNSAGATIANVGEVNVRYGSSNGLTAGAQQFRQAFNGVGGTSEAEDAFGISLTAWNFGRNEGRFRGTIRTSDLAVGVPFEDLNDPDTFASLPDSGAVQVLYGTRSAGLAGSDSQLFFQTNIGSGFTNVAQDRFGASVY